MLASPLDLFRARRRNGADVRPGAVYRHASQAASVETAQVLEICHDNTGIAHVKFRVNIARGQTTFVDEERILALDSFRNRFQDRVHG